MAENMNIREVKRLVFVCMFLAALSCIPLLAGPGKPVYEFTVSVSGPSGLAWDGQNFWTCGEDHNIYCFSTMGDIVHVIPMPDTGHMENYHPFIAWDGQYLWFANYCDVNAERAVFQLDPVTGTPLKEFRNQWIERAGDNGYGLEYSPRTGYLILSQGSGYNRLITLDSHDGSFVCEAPLPGWPHLGMALIDDVPNRSLWIQTTKGLVRVRPSDGYTYTVVNHDKWPSGITCINDNYLVKIDSAGKVSVYRVSSTMVRHKIHTFEPWSDSFHWPSSWQDLPALSWSAEGCDDFVIEVCRRADFSGPVEYFPMGNRTRVQISEAVADRMIYGATYYWRVCGYVNGTLAKQSKTRELTKYN